VKGPADCLPGLHLLLFLFYQVGRNSRPRKGREPGIRHTQAGSLGVREGRGRCGNFGEALIQGGITSTNQIGESERALNGIGSGPQFR